MVCSQCHTPNFRDYKYCRECGSRLESVEPASPNDAAEVESLVRHAFAQMEQGELTRALATVQAALAHDPESPAAHSALGLIYERQGLITEAIHQFRVVLRLTPDSAADREKLEQLLARGGREPVPGVFTPVRLAVASAVAAGVLTFGVGLAVARGNEGKSRSYRAGALGMPLPTSASTARKLTPQPVQPMRPTPPAPQPKASLTPAFSTAHAPARLPSYAPPPSSTVALQPAWGRRESSRPTPPPPWQVNRPQTPARSNGLPPAAIGEVVPLSRPDLSPYPVEGAEKPKLDLPRTAEAKPRRVEPLEPDTGFIKIEPEKPAAAAPSGAAPAPGGSSGSAPVGENSRPSISITISPGAR